MRVGHQRYSLQDSQFLRQVLVAVENQLILLMFLYVILLPERILNPGLHWGQCCQLAGVWSISNIIEVKSSGPSMDPELYSMIYNFVCACTGQF